MNIYEKMAAITSELQTVGKNLDVETGRGKSYKAVSERDILDAVKPMESKYKVYSYPAEREILESSMLDSSSTYNGQTNKRTTFFTRIRTVYRFVNIEDPSEFIETTVFSEGIDTQDKGSGKAMTYADKYALMKAYKISTGDDPDQDPSNPEGYTPRRDGSNPPERQQSGNQPPRNGPPVCSRCGKEIKTAILKTGQTMSPADLVAFSISRHGAPHCAGCLSEMSNKSRRSIGNNVEPWNNDRRN